MFIDDENGERCYEANGEIAFSPIWTIRNTIDEVATVQRKVWLWSPTWNIKSIIGTFLVKRKVFAWSRTYNIIGGPYDGSIVKGNIWDLKFEIIHENKCIASAKGKLLSIRDTHNIVVHDSEVKSEIITAIVMVILHLDRRNANDDEDDQNS